jgi:Raf kinase inhibitor-like YbhB/YbcL family protein
MILQLPGFPDGGTMPRKYTAQGDEVSPELEWMELPEGTESLVLFMYDVSIPADWLRLGTIDHWVVYNIPPALGGLPEGLPEQYTLENGALQGKRWGRRTGYMGPDPLTGTHLYVFELYSLDKMLDVAPEEATRKSLTEAMKGFVLDKAVYAGKYRKSRLE